MKSKKLMKLCFAAYGLLMIWLLFIRFRGIAVTDYWAQISGRINLIPFTSTASMLRTLWQNPRPDVLWVVIYNLGGNIIMFIPLGFFLRAISGKCRNFRYCMGMVALIMTGVELIQLLSLRGFCEIDDVMLNLLGAGIGFWIQKKIER